MATPEQASDQKRLKLSRRGFLQGVGALGVSAWLADKGLGSNSSLFPGAVAVEAQPSVAPQHAEVVPVAEKEPTPPLPVATPTPFKIETPKFASQEQLALAGGVLYKAKAESTSEAIGPELIGIDELGKELTAYIQGELERDSQATAQFERVAEFDASGQLKKIKDEALTSPILLFQEVTSKPQIRVNSATDELEVGEGESITDNHVVLVRNAGEIVPISLPTVSQANQELVPEDDDGDLVYRSGSSAISFGNLAEMVKNPTAAAPKQFIDATNHPVALTVEQQAPATGGSAGAEAVEEVAFQYPASLTPASEATATSTVLFYIPSPEVGTYSVLPIPAESLFTSPIQGLVWNEAGRYDVLLQGAPEPVAQYNPETGEFAFVARAASDGATLRTEPVKGDNQCGSLEPNESFLFAGRTKEKVVISKANAYWLELSEEAKRQREIKKPGVWVYGGVAVIDSRINEDALPEAKGEDSASVVQAADMTDALPTGEFTSRYTVQFPPEELLTRLGLTNDAIRVCIEGNKYRLEGDTIIIEQPDGTIALVNHQLPNSRNLWGIGLDEAARANSRIIGSAIDLRIDHWSGRGDGYGAVALTEFSGAVTPDGFNPINIFRKNQSALQEGDVYAGTPRFDIFDNVIKIFRARNPNAELTIHPFMWAYFTDFETSKKMFSHTSHASFMNFLSAAAEHYNGDDPALKADVLVVANEFAAADGRIVWPDNPIFQMKDLPSTVARDPMQLLIDGYRIVREKAPQARLAYRDKFDMYEQRDQMAQARSIVAIATRLYDEGLLDVLDLQLHIDMSRGGWLHKDAFAHVVTEAKKKGIEVRMPEITVGASTAQNANDFSKPLTAEQQQQQAKHVSEIVDFADEHGITMLGVWGPIADKQYAWRANGLLFDANGNPLPAAIVLRDKLQA